MSAALTDLHLRCRFQGVVFERFARAEYPIDPELFGDSDSEVGGEGEVEDAVLVCLVEFLEAGFEDEVIEFFVHGQHSSRAVHHRFHLHQSELVQTVGPDVEGVFPLHQQLLQALVEGSCRFDVLRVLVPFDDVHVGTDRVLQGQVYHFAQSHCAGAAS